MKKIRCDNCIHFEVCCYVSPQLPTCDNYKEKERHGKWTERLDVPDDIDCDTYVHHMCSECKADAIFKNFVIYDWDEGIDGEWQYNGQITVGIEEYLTDFCPNCGAKMDL